MRIAMSCLLTIALLGCGGKKEEEKAAPAAGSAGVGTPLPAVSGLQLLVGTTAVATLDAAAVKDWPRLDGLLPAADRRLGQWQAITTTNASGKASELLKPFETYRDYVPALFPGEGGTISFGLFDAVELGKRGKPALREDNVKKLVIKLDESGSRGGNDHGGGAVIDPAHVTLKVTTAKGTTELTGEKLLGIEREAMPGGGGEAKGWKLGVVLAAAGVTSFTKVTLVDADGASIPLEKSDIGPNDAPFIKLNRSGQMRFRLYKKQGEGFQSGAELRSLVEIKVQ